MAGGGSILSKISVRFATLADYHVTLKITENAFDGSDYLRYAYHDFVRNPNTYNFVAELDGEVVRMFDIIIFTYPINIISVTPFLTLHSTFLNFHVTASLLVKSLSPASVF